MVGAVGEELVVPRARHQFGLGVLVFLEDETRAFLMDVETVLDDNAELNVEAIVVEGLSACAVNLQR